MTYTQNHHLPQWERTDKIKMRDFNDAMTAIDNGLTANENKTFDSLCRLAYNHYNLLLDAGNLSKWSGTFRQGFAREDNGNVSGAYQKEDRIWIASSTRTPAQSSLGDLIQTQPMTFAVRTAVFTFTTSCPGRIKSIAMTGQYIINAASPDSTITARLINQSTGETEATSVFDTGLHPSSNNAYKVTLQFDLPFHGGQNYRLELERNEQRTTYELALSADTSTNFMTLDRVDVQPSADITHSFREEAAAQGAFVLAHYRVASAPGGTVTLRWDGQTASPCAARSVTDSQGRTVTEAEFRLNRTIPADCGITLHAECTGDGELELFDWGGMLI